MSERKTFLNQNVTTLSTMAVAARPKTDMFLAKPVFEAKTNEVEVKVSRIMQEVSEGVSLIVEINDKELDQSGIFELDLAEVIFDMALDFCDQAKKNPTDTPASESEYSALSDEDMAAMAKKQMSEGK